ncbi:hypothetical protein apy_02590 [Aeropyrum pernix]|uniref:Polysaccharide biosynthesis protein C-terminal domain-containing protein n=1 Tax=Aeropyrum pernix TaxID=56636 RepID=A0A401H806_AERPX|nr:hypothetical protein [Aeropyrum pernix]GBF08534.1 hypothetical protein apy_02590 [Aeropyrum pernix]
MDKSLEKTIRGATWIYLASLTSTATGFLFWLTIARLAGAEAVGAASLVASSAGMAATILSAGLPLAVARETAARGGQGAAAAIAVGLLVGAIGGIVAYILTLRAGLESFSLYASLFAGTSIVAATLNGVLLGLLKFRLQFATVALGNLAKLLVGVGLAITGYGALAAVAGLISMPLMILAVGSSALFALALKRGIPRITGDSVASLVALAASNYPLSFSTQFFIFLSVYLYKLLGGNLESTGGLYISFMILLAIAGLPSSLQIASLPVATKLGGRPQETALRLGIAIAIPPTIVVIVLAPQLLSLINSELTESVGTLRILLLAVPSLVAFAALTSTLNVEARGKSLALLGISTLAVTTTLMLPLTKAFSDRGVALAFLAGTTINVALQARRLGLPLKPLAIAQATQLIAILTTLYMPTVLALTVALSFSITVMLRTRVITVNDIMYLKRLVIKILD